MREFPRIYFCVVLGLLLVCANHALGWGPGKHVDLAGQYYADPLIAGFAAEFGTDVMAVVNGADDLDFVGDPHHAIYHAGQWLMSLNREYVYTPASPTDWFDLDETTRLKYMMHNLGDTSVPLGHSPAREIDDNDIKEGLFELTAEGSTYGSLSTPATWYTGKISDCVNQFYNDCIANARYFRDNVSTLCQPTANAAVSSPGIMADFSDARQGCAYRLLPGQAGGC